MTIFFQQSGKKGEADFLKTISDSTGNIRHYSVQELVHKNNFQIKQTSLGLLTNELRFQIWGVPSGARQIMDLMRPGDIILLIGYLNPKGLEFGRFYYAGQVVHVQNEDDHRLSRDLWGEGGFPLIFFSQGVLVDYPWSQFQSDFGFNRKYFEAGTIKRVLERRVHASPYKSEASFAQFLGVYSCELNAPETTSQIISQTYDQSTAREIFGFSDIKDGFESSNTKMGLEGDKVPREHYEIERSSNIVKIFKASLTSFACAICHFDFEKTYGLIGRGYIEAHHLKPLSEGTRVTTLSDFLPVCANCHRMLHRDWPNNKVSSLRACFAPGYVRLLNSFDKDNTG